MENKRKRIIHFQDTVKCIEEKISEKKENKEFLMWKFEESLGVSKGYISRLKKLKESPKFLVVIKILEKLQIEIVIEKDDEEMAIKDIDSFMEIFINGIEELRKKGKTIQDIEENDLQISNGMISRWRKNKMISYTYFIEILTFLGYKVWNEYSIEGIISKKEVTLESSNVTQHMNNIDSTFENIINEYVKKHLKYNNKLRFALTIIIKESSPAEKREIVDMLNKIVMLEEMRDEIT